MSIVRILPTREQWPRQVLARAINASILVTILLIINPTSTTVTHAQQPAPSSTQQTAPATKASPPTTLKSKGKETERAPAEMHTGGSITGRVINEEGQPIANVGVNLSLRSAVMRPSTNWVTTGEDGKFRADNLDPGAYIVRAFVPGYVFSSDWFSERGERNYHRLGDNVTITLRKGGIITGTVTNANGDPVVAASIRAIYVRDLLGRTLPNDGGTRFYGRPTMTDDRGIYRMYGLEPGIYVVSIGGDSSWGLPSGHEGDTPTYYPSSTRDAAAEVTVQAGQEAMGIDIRYRGERGRSVSGTISGVPDSESDFNSNGISVSLAHASTGVIESSAFVSGNSGDRTFSFDGVADGEYDLMMHRFTRTGVSHAAPPHRVSVRGADVTGLKLALAPLASISGRLILEPVRDTELATETCANTTARAALPQESIIVARRDEQRASADQPRLRLPSRSDIAPDAKGEFTIQGIDAGRYYLQALPPGEDWYVRAINIPGAAATPTSSAKPGRGTARTGAPASAPSNNSAQTALSIRSGERIGGITVSVAGGAARLRGQVVADGEGTRLPAQLRVHLAPSEHERADDVLRFAESTVSGDGTFALSHIAPGRYWLLLRLVNDNESTKAPARPEAWNGEARAKLRREAEAAGLVVDLQACQRLNDFTLRYPLSTAK